MSLGLLKRAGFLHILVLFCGFGLLFVGVPNARPAATTTVVSLTFDDGTATAPLADSILAAHGMKGTFYVNSGHVGTAGSVTWGQLAAIAADGNEVGGHTLDHVDLTTISYDQVRYEVCEDRARLLNHGFAATNFAYPGGQGFHDATIKSIIQQCGYNSARRGWGLNSDGSCPTCPYAETVPPADAYATRAAWPEVTSDTTLDTVEKMVTVAETNGGGWVQIIFHDICDGCQPYAWSAQNLQAFLDWLAPRASQGTVVKTVAQVIGGPLQGSPGTADQVSPTSSISCSGSTCASGWYPGPVQVALAASDTGGSGLEAIRYTTDGSTPTLTSQVYSGPFAVSATTTVSYRAWDNAGNVESTKAQLVQIDGTAPTVAITSPTSGSIVTGTIQVQAGASDVGSGVDHVTFYLDGQAVATSTGLPYKFPWNTKKAAKGQHTLTAVAVDRVGRTTTSAPVTITVK